MAELISVIWSRGSRMYLRALLVVLMLSALPVCQAAPPEPDLHSVNELDVDNLHGRVVVLGLWAHWCGPCKTYLSWLDELSNSMPKAKSFVAGISVSGDFKSAMEFMRANHARTVSYDAEQSGKFNKFDITSIPTTLVLDPDGNELLRFAGEVPSKEAEERISNIVALVNAPAASRRAMAAEFSALDNNRRRVGRKKSE